jgi:hypothetical protein
MNAGFFAESFLGGAFEWLTAGITETFGFLGNWIAASFTPQILAYITGAIVVVAVLVRITSNRHL